MRRLIAVTAVATTIAAGLVAVSTPARAATCAISVAKDASGSLTATVTWDPSDPAYASATTTGTGLRVEILQFAPNPLITAIVPLSAGTYSAPVVAGQASVSGIVTAPNPPDWSKPYGAGTCFTGDATVPDTKVAVTGISPNTATEAGGGTAEITGANLGTATSVTIGSVGASIVAATDGKVAVTIPSVGTNPTGTAVDVTVTTPAGSATLTSAFTYTSNPPSVALVTPSCGIAAGSTLAITGYRFTGTTSVSIGGQSVAFTVTDSTHIEATAPALTGSQPVIVTTAAGSSSGLSTVSYLACSPLPKPALTVTSTDPVGGFATIRWSFAASDPSLGNVLGLQYGPGPGGPYTNVGGTQSGTSGEFTVAGLTKSPVLVWIRVVNRDPLGKPLMQPVAVQFASTPTPLPPNTGNAGSVPSPAQVAAQSSGSSTSSSSSGSGSSSDSGSSSGSTTPADGAAIGAPCLAPAGSLYPAAFGTVGSQLVVAPGRPGDPAPTFMSVTSGALPPGLGLDTKTGIVYGVPTAAGRYLATLSGRAADGSKVSGDLSITVDNSAQTLTYPVLVAGVRGQTVQTGPTTNAPAGSTYEIVCGTLPAGVALDVTSGRITGTPTQVDLRNPPLRIVERNKGGSAAASFVFLVTPEGSAQVSYPAHPHLRKGKRVTLRPTVIAAGDLLYFKVIKGKLTKGLRLNAKTGVITGKARRGGKPHTITIAGVHSDGSLVVANPMTISVRRHR